MTNTFLIHSFIINSSGKKQFTYISLIYVWNNEHGFNLIFLREGGGIQNCPNIKMKKKWIIT